MPLAGLVTAGVGSLIGIGKGIADISRSKKIKPQYTPFQISESAKRMQGLAQAQLNARAPGAAQRDRGIQGSQAQMLGAVGRGVTDSATALQMAAASQAQAGREQASAQDADAQYYQSAIGRLFGAEQNMQQQEGMKYQEDFRKFQLDTQMKEALRSEGFQGITGGLQNFGGMMMSAGLNSSGGAATQGVSAQGAPVDRSISMPNLPTGPAGMYRPSNTAQIGSQYMNYLSGYANNLFGGPSSAQINPQYMSYLSGYANNLFRGPGSTFSPNVRATQTGQFQPSATARLVP
jgi:hypothetical protein